MKANIIITSMVCLAAAAVAVGCGNQKKKAEAEKAAEQARLDSLKQVEMIEKQKAAGDLMSRLPEEPVFDIVTSLGTIKVKLYSKTPKHRANFEKLALTGFYDSLLFHRVINGFMIQGGDPYTRDTTMADKYGQGGPGYTIPAEFVPEYKHLLPLPEEATQPTLQKSHQARSSTSSRTKIPVHSLTENTPYSDRQWTGSMSLTKSRPYRQTAATVRSLTSASSPSK